MISLTCFLVSCPVHDPVRALFNPVKTIKLLDAATALDSWEEWGQLRFDLDGGFGRGVPDIPDKH